MPSTSLDNAQCVSICAMVCAQAAQPNFSIVLCSLVDGVVDGCHRKSGIINIVLMTPKLIYILCMIASHSQPLTEELRCLTSTGLN